MSSVRALSINSHENILGKQGKAVSPIGFHLRNGEIAGFVGLQAPPLIVFRGGRRITGKRQSSLSNRLSIGWTERFLGPMQADNSMGRKKISASDFVRMKALGKRLVMVTSYDYPTASVADESGVDAILVGDSYGMVILGYDTTIQVTLEELLPVCRAVRRGAMHPLLIGDLPFLSYQASRDDAIRNAGRLIKHGGMDAVKLEGGREIVQIAKAICDVGIPVMGHMGLKPQTATLHAGYRVQGRTADSGKRLILDAKALEEAGVFSIVLDMITEDVARIITETVSVPTIGIGSGRYCDGQVLVLHDILGLYPRLSPKFARKYTELWPVVRHALEEFSAEVRKGLFPDERHVFKRGI